MSAPTVLLPYLLAFCRVVIGLVFAASFWGKIADIGAFERTITRFGILPERGSRSAALVLLGGEVVVVALVARGGPFLIHGFALAALLLLAFSGVLVSALARDSRISCNCFGPGMKPISTADLWRNIALGACALGGCVLLGLSGGEHGDLSTANWALVGLTSALYVTACMHLGEILQLFRRG